MGCGVNLERLRTELCLNYKYEGLISNIELRPPSNLNGTRHVQLFRPISGLIFRLQRNSPFKIHAAVSGCEMMRHFKYRVITPSVRGITQSASSDYKAAQTGPSADNKLSEILSLSIAPSFSPLSSCLLNDFLISKRVMQRLKAGRTGAY